MIVKRHCGGGDRKAIDLLRKRLAAAAKKRRITAEGIVDSIHTGGRIGVPLR